MSAFVCSSGNDVCLFTSQTHGTQIPHWEGVVILFEDQTPSITYLKKTKKNPIISGKAEKDITAKGGFIWSLRWILYDIYLEISYGEANDQLTLVHRQNLNHNPKKKMEVGSRNIN